MPPFAISKNPLMTFFLAVGTGMFVPFAVPLYMQSEFGWKRGPAIAAGIASVILLPITIPMGVLFGLFAAGADVYDNLRT